MAQTKLKAVNLRMEYYQPRTGGRLLALDNVNLQVDEGEFVTIVGPSGCGKTTFINLADGRTIDDRRSADNRTGNRPWNGFSRFLPDALENSF